jgi:predicted phage terminase large subunit-like protein
VEPDGEKTARMRAVSPLCEAGNVWIPEEAPFVTDFLGEVTTVPLAANDDQADAMSQTLRRLSLGMSDAAKFEALSAL